MMVPVLPSHVRMRVRVVMVIVAGVRMRAVRMLVRPVLRRRRIVAFHGTRLGLPRLVLRRRRILRAAGEPGGEHQERERMGGTPHHFFLDVSVILRFNAASSSSTDAEDR